MYALKHMTFPKYLQDKGRKQNFIDQCKLLMEQLQKDLNEAESIHAAIGKFILRDQGFKHLDNSYMFLGDYATFCEGDDDEFAETIRNVCNDIYAHAARRAMDILRSHVVPIPQDTKINPTLLNGLTNEEFVDAFRTLQEIVLAIYDEIEKVPAEWGWHHSAALWAGGNGGHHNRVMKILGLLVGSGQPDGNTEIIDKKHFGLFDFTKKENGRTMLPGLRNVGFELEGLEDKKSKSFSFSCPDTPNVVPVLRGFMQNWFQIFSYRVVEDPAEQKYWAGFLAITDKMPEDLREIHYWVYDEGAKYGQTLLTHNTYDFICYDHVWYEKPGKTGAEHYPAAKHFLVYGVEKANVRTQFTSVFFKRFTEKAEKMKKRFPAAFSIPVEKNTYTFENVTLKDVQFLFDMYKLENKLKPLT